MRRKRRIKRHRRNRTGGCRSDKVVELHGDTLGQNLGNRPRYYATISYTKTVLHLALQLAQKSEPSEAQTGSAPL